MTVRFDDCEVVAMDFTTVRGELHRLMSGPTYEVPSAHIALVAARAASMAPTSCDLAGVVAVTRGWLVQHDGGPEAEQVRGAIASRPFAPEACIDTRRSWM